MCCHSQKQWDVLWSVSCYIETLLWLRLVISCWKCDFDANALQVFLSNPLLGFVNRNSSNPVAVFPQMPQSSRRQYHIIIKLLSVVVIRDSSKMTSWGHEENNMAGKQAGSQFLYNWNDSCGVPYIIMCLNSWFKFLILSCPCIFCGV